jgi:predicted secreted protein
MRVLYRGEPCQVKRTFTDADGVKWHVLEDDEGLAFMAGDMEVEPIGYSAAVDADGYVTSLEDAGA